MCKKVNLFKTFSMPNSVVFLGICRGEELIDM